MVCHIENSLIYHENVMKGQRLNFKVNLFNLSVGCNRNAFSNLLQYECPKSKYLYPEATLQHYVTQICLCYLSFHMTTYLNFTLLSGSK